MEKNTIIMKGKKSHIGSSFSVFENLNSWKLVAQDKVIPVGSYFAVLTVGSKQVEVRPDLFVQGYRPHSSSKVLSVQKRRYGAFVRNGTSESQKYDDDVHFAQANLYQRLGELEVELVLSDGESHDKDAMTALVLRICEQQSLQPLGELKVLKYSCKSSKAYFLAGRSYKVWAVMVGKDEDMSMMKKVLIFDYETGIPALVDYDETSFTEI